MKKILVAITIGLAIAVLPSAVLAVPDPAQNPTLEWNQTLATGLSFNSKKLATINGMGYFAIDDTSLGYPDYSWRIEKRDLTTGALVPGFGTGGVVAENPSSDGDSLTAIAVDDTGLYIGGYNALLGSTNYQWHIEKRDLTTGALVPGFGTGGEIDENLSVGNDSIGDFAIDTTGLYIGGLDSALGNYQWRIEKRDLTTGALITEFGTAGVVTENPSAGYDYIMVINLSNTGLYVAGTDSTPDNYQIRLEKRDLTTGALITEFGTAGVITENPSAGDDYINSLTADITGLYLGGSDKSSGEQQWRIEKRDLTTGILIPAFDTDGVVTINPSNSDYDQASSIILDSTGLYVGGWDLSPDPDAFDAQWRIEKRDLTTGAFIPGFGTNGIMINDPSDYFDLFSAFILDGTGLYILGTDDGVYHFVKYAFPQDSTPPTFENLPGLTVPINLTEGQVVTTNPYIINVKPVDNIEIAYVEFYVDGVLICTDNTADENGVYSCVWDTSLYHSDIQVYAYDTTGNRSVALNRTVNVSLTGLPNTGLSVWYYLLGLVPALGILIIRKAQRKAAC